MKLGAIGLQYQRRLIANRHLVWSYGMEFRPVIIQSYPTVRSITTVLHITHTTETFWGGAAATAKCIPSSQF